MKVLIHLISIFLFILSADIPSKAAVDTTIYFKGFRQPVKEKEDAKFYMQYGKNEDGKIPFKKFTSAGILEEEGWLSAQDSVTPQAILTTFYPEGAIKQTEDFSTPDHLKTVFFKTGDANYKIYDARYLPTGITKCKFIFCKDNTGKVILDKGNGIFRRYNEDGLLAEEGSVKDSLAEGEWKGHDEKGKLQYKESYEGGTLAIGERYDESGQKTDYTVLEMLPEPTGGMKNFYKHIGKNFKFPSEAKRSGAAGKVIVTFVIEADGSTSSFEIVKSLTPLIDAEAIRVIEAYPKWNPGKQRGKSVRVTYTLPMAFNF